MKSRVIYIIVAIVVALALVMMGCTGEKPAQQEPVPSDTPSDTPSETASDDTETDYMNPVGVLPIVKEGQDITIKVFLRTTEMVTDLYTNDYTLYLTEKTGIKFEWEQPLEADAQDRLNLLINTDEYP
ncbi:MAG: hypothetical protein GX094_02035, partial [Clostridiales bacterium]|nr:hypothetical protein [Clostridiales bacterium]